MLFLSVESKSKSGSVGCVEGGYWDIYFFFFFWWLHSTASGILVPQPGIEQVSGSESAKSWPLDR